MIVVHPALFAAIGMVLSSLAAYIAYTEKGIPWRFAAALLAGAGIALTGTGAVLAVLVFAA